MPYLTTSPIGTAGGLVAGVVAKFDVPDSTKLAKTMFELSRDTDMTTHFDPDVHTLKLLGCRVTLLCHAGRLSKKI